LQRSGLIRATRQKEQQRISCSFACATIARNRRRDNIHSMGCRYNHSVCAGTWYNCYTS
jgi:hypothetical protein